MTYFRKFQVTYFGKLAIWTVHVLEKVLFLCFWVPREINPRFCSKSQWQMFLLISGRHVGAHLDGHQHGVSIQISINLGRKCIGISCLPETLCIFNFFLFPDSELYLVNGFDFWSILKDVTLKTSNMCYFSSYERDATCIERTELQSILLRKIQLRFLIK